MKRTQRPQAPWLDANEIKRQVPMSTVLDKYGLRANLEQRGGSLVGPSPFSESQEKTFSVNLERGIWNDGASRPVVEGREVSGNIIGLTQVCEGGISFRRALEILSEEIRDQTGRSLLSEGPADEPPAARADVLRREAQAEREEGNTIFGKELGGLRAEVPFLQDERGISPSTAKAFGVGLALRGLLRSRVAFPVKDTRGRIVAYGGRSLKDNDPSGRYRYPSGFRLHLEVFNIDRVVLQEEVRERVKALGLVVVDSPFDVLRLHETGVINAVAPLGVVPSEEQAQLLLDSSWNPSLKVTLMCRESEQSKEKRRAWAKLLIRRGFLRFTDSKSMM